MENLAPVLIPTLNRYEHFKRCVESLSACTHADKTDLYVALDYPLSESHWDGYKKSKAYLQDIKGFNSVNIIGRQKNFGAQENIYDARKSIFEKYDRMILSEDDNEFSPNFLEYINKGLEKFENWQNVYSICGYNYPIKMPSSYTYNYYFHREFSAWGNGIWKSKFQIPRLNPKKLKEFILDGKNVRELNRLSGRHYYNTLTSIRTNTPRIGDFSVFINNIIYDRYCVFPSVSKVRNHGHDGSGIHCGNLNKKRKENVYASQHIDLQCCFDFLGQPPFEDEKIIRQLKKYFNMKSIIKVREILKYYIFYLNKKYGSSLFHVGSV
ncbi:glycosyltransferase family A protein [Desulfocicer niacini]